MRYGLTFGMSGAASAIFALAIATPAHAAEPLLRGMIKSSSGEAMGGVTVSAKPEGGTITTTVFTDEAGNYYFPPLPGSKYRVWAQALSFQTAKSDVDLTANRTHDFTLAPMDDPERTFRQLPGSAVIAALPDATPQDELMKRTVSTVCSACHTASFPLQHRFDAAGWNAILGMMKDVTVYGIYGQQGRPTNDIIEHHQKDLVDYLVRARGPGQTSMQVKLDPRPGGEAARVAFREYDLPLDPDANLPADFVRNDGSDWSLGTPSSMIPGWGVHDATLDLSGNIWFANPIPNKRMTIGKIDAKTGAVKLFLVSRANGTAATGHGIIHDANGVIWFNVDPGRGGLGRIDPKTEKLDVFLPPSGMTPTGGNVSLDFDGKGMIWVTTPVGTLRFDPQAERFTEFKSATTQSSIGIAQTYGVAADRSGNAYWAQMALDTIAVGNAATGKSTEIKLAPIKATALTADDRKFYESRFQLSFNSPPPWGQGPRRMGMDKNGNVLWIADSWGGNLARIDTLTHETSFVPLPGGQRPYHVEVDRNHNAWTDLWNGDRVLRYDPNTSTWTTFDLPTRGAEARYVSLLERDGQPTQVVVPYFRARKVAVMILRSEADLQALKELADSK
jgi:streptogramin lyase